jgi:hypothetical protein
MSVHKKTQKKKDPTSDSHKILVYATVALAIATGFLAVANVVLVSLTYYYLKETRAQRVAAQQSTKLTEQFFKFETSPKPYIKDVETQWRLSESRPDTVLGTTSIKLANCGRTEGTNVRLHTILTKGSLTKEETIKLLEYIYPGQIPLYTMSTLKIEVTQEAILALKEGNTLKIPMEKQEPIKLRIELMYDEPKGGSRSVPYDFQYNYALNRWVPAGFGAK